MLVSGLICDGSGIEGDHIGEITRAQQAALRDADGPCRKIAARVDHEGQGDHLFLVHIYAQLAPESAEHALTAMRKTQARHFPALAPRPGVAEEGERKSARLKPSQTG